MMQFAQSQDCAGAFSYNPQNGRNNLKMHSQKCMGSMDNIEKREKELSMYSLRLSLGKQKKSSTESKCTDVCT
eukprot:12642058-Ditylum_brightwellii.AAC.2